MPGPSPLPAAPVLPGATADPGSGPVEAALLDGLLDDTGPLAGHRDLLAGDHRDLLAALEIPATVEATDALVEGLIPGDGGIRVVLAAPTLEGLRAARSLLLDVDAVELIGIRVPVPQVDGPDPAAATLDLLDALDSSVPAWITVPPGPAAAPVLGVLAADGVEHATLDLAAGSLDELTDLLRRLVDAGLPFRVTGTPGVHGGPMPGGHPGLLNLLCATRAALAGATPADLREMLAVREVAPLVAALRGTAAADAAAVRALLVAAQVPDAGHVAAELAGLGLLPHPEG